MDLAGSAADCSKSGLQFEAVRDERVRARAPIHLWPIPCRGNQPQLFSEIDRKDICTDLSCFRAEVAAYVTREKERVLAVGGTVLNQDESRRIFAGGATLPYNSKWIDLDSPCFDDAKRRTRSSSTAST